MQLQSPYLPASITFLPRRLSVPGVRRCRNLVSRRIRYAKSSVGGLRRKTAYIAGEIDGLRRETFGSVAYCFSPSLYFLSLSCSLAFFISSSIGFDITSLSVRVRSLQMGRSSFLRLRNFSSAPPVARPLGITLLRRAHVRIFKRIIIGTFEGLVCTSCTCCLIDSWLSRKLSAVASCSELHAYDIRSGDGRMCLESWTPVEASDGSNLYSGSGLRAPISTVVYVRVLCGCTVRVHANSAAELFSLKGDTVFAKEP